ncbi:hypothetical protein Phum_PHUM088390 [Pediculus humanus corporis]|uniref:Uncharacterized protein n=1 Tax=Pediculus humanus subsp. corporis TaxID=121224 RepID=E0VCK1_PEDHC|nr:uncharacterized protein Phum_PHUM088390 [Pediculus humanus corporis]EEB11107.1 hypothetical protein Phum_PHUM088390 [Pediculus humanus corporis]
MEISIVKEILEKNVMWIGPRLGRRKRSDDDNTNQLDKNSGPPGVLELLQESPWAIVALKGPLRSSIGGKRRTVNFIPRLGRDSEEEYVDAPPDFAKSSSRSGNGISYGGGSNNFTPRLGRYVNLYGKDHL